MPAPGPVPQDLQAASIEQVQRLHIAVGDCATVLSRNLHAHGFTIAARPPADASLRLQLRHKRPLREHLPIIQTLGWQAHYRADIIGADQRLLLSLYGQEGSLSFRELCDDIGDEIANKLKDYLPDRDLTSRKGAKTQK